MSLERGHIIRGHYRIIQELKRGGQAQTYLAKDLNQEDTRQSQCVIKQLNQSQLTNLATLAEARSRFQLEAQTLKELEHPQIPRLIDYFEEENELYLVQEYIDGFDLKHKLEESSPWSEQHVICMLIDVLPTLTYIHQKEIIHRDIKPSNLIMREQDGKIFVIDFGVVKELNELLTILTETGQAPGTPMYMAPEHRRNNPYFSSENNRYSPSSDLYSLGLVAIEALIGEYPSDILGTYKVNWSNYRVSLDLAAILDRMVHCLVRERYQSAQEVLEHLEPLSIVYRRYKIKRVLG